MENKKSNKPDTRTRNWTFLVYPESAPENWRDILLDVRVPWVESPLHDSDKNPDGEKKAHWHVAIAFEGNKSFEQVKEITDNIISHQKNHLGELVACKGSTIPQKVTSMIGLVRYFIHLDDPDKHQYDKSEIKAYCGFDLENYFKPTQSSRYQHIGEMIDWIEESDCMELSILLRYAKENFYESWYKLLCDNSAYIVNEYIKSKRNHTKDLIQRSYNNLKESIQSEYDKAPE
jgi:hypothetical protein